MPRDGFHGGYRQGYPYFTYIAKSQTLNSLPSYVLAMNMLGENMNEAVEEVDIEEFEEMLPEGQMDEYEDIEEEITEMVNAMKTMYSLTDELMDEHEEIFRRFYLYIMSKMFASRVAEEELDDETEVQEESLNALDESSLYR